MSRMAYIDVVFDSSSNLDVARRKIVERVETARVNLPANVRVAVGPAASTTGWVFEYALVDPFRRESPLHLRQFQDDVLRPALAALPGVAEVASVGGGVQQIVTVARTEQLRARR